MNHRQPATNRIDLASRTSQPHSQGTEAVTSSHLDDDSLDEVVPNYYAEGTNYEYHEPPFVLGEHRRPSLDQLTGTYDVVLHAEQWVGDKLTTVRGGTLAIERTADYDYRGGPGHRGRGVIFRFDIGFGESDADDPRDEEDPRDLSCSVRDDWCVVTSEDSSRGMRYVNGWFDIIPTAGAVSATGRVRIVAERSPLFLLTSEGGGGGGGCGGRLRTYPSPPSGNHDEHESESERRRRGEGALTRYRDGFPHWLHNHTSLPAEVVAQVLRYLHPPPVWFYEAGDLWIEGMWKNSCPLESWYHEWRYVARRRGSD